MVQADRSSSTVFFDLLSYEGIVAVLSYIRQSSLSRPDKKSLRDLVFSYVTSGGDQGLRTALENRLAAMTPSKVVTPQSAAPVETIIAPTPMAKESVAPFATPVLPQAVVQPQAGFAPARAVPSFGQSMTTANSTIPMDPVRNLSVRSAVEPIPADRVQLPKEVPQTAVSDTPAVPPVVPMAEVPVASVATSVTPEETVAPVVAPDTKATTNTPSYVPAASPVTDGATTAQVARISEIKNLINAKVGNPVNLVDMDNEVGRAYMSQLLEAMKIAGGGEGDLTTAMSRLESTVTKVLQVIEQKQTKVTTAPEVETSYNTASPINVPPVVPVEPVYTPAVPVVPAKSVAPVMSTTHDTGLPSVSNLPPLKTPADLPTAMDLKARMGVTDPLHDADVDTGLDQLLSEWSLFKKSGIFGTGPKGRQHPLFLTLAPLSLSMIIAGRFDGVTPEIRQSISDYMNGWRYEQGITFESDETFEHYLRRVIRHIIDSQNRRRTA